MIGGGRRERNRPAWWELRDRNQGSLQPIPIHQPGIFPGAANPACLLRKFRDEQETVGLSTVQPLWEARGLTVIVGSWRLSQPKDLDWAYRIMVPGLQRGGVGGQ